MAHKGIQKVEEIIERAEIDMHLTLLRWPTRLQKQMENYLAI